jgi:hypothetical protein
MLMNAASYASLGISKDLSRVELYSRLTDARERMALPLQNSSGDVSSAFLVILTSL